jgi:hypothetical protein
MTFANLRGILHDGVERFLDRLADEEADEGPKQLVEDLHSGLDRRKAAGKLEFILRAVVENYDAYKDYNTTTTQSDYGENLHILLELLRVKAGYDRHRWALQPAYIAHGILAAKGRPRAAVLLERAFAEETSKIAEGYSDQLQRVERRYGVRLSSIADRIGERFVQPLHLDRLLALAAPAVDEAKRGKHVGAFEEFQKAAEEFVEKSNGVGLDLPSWIRQVESEIERIVAPAEDDLDALEQQLQGPAVQLSHDQFAAHIREWDAAEDSTSV